MNERQRRAAAVDRQLEERSPLRPLLLGHAPSQEGAGWPALTGRPGDAVARLAGLPVFPGCRPAAVLMLVAERRNLLDFAPGSATARDAFAPMRLRAAAVALLEELSAGERLEGRRVVYLGRAVAGAFAHAGEWMTWRETAPACLGGEVRYQAAALPHPDRRNRWYDDAANRFAASLFLRRLFRYGPG